MKTTIEFKGVDFDVEYYYQPYEAPERGPEAQYPGCGESVALEGIWHNDVDFMEVVIDYVEEIEEIILKNHYDRT